MNILFVLYGGFDTNTANPLALYTRELQRLGHECAIAVPGKLETVSQHENICFRPVSYDDVLADPDAVFSNHRPADVIHACTPREVVRRFVVSYMAGHPTPLVIYLEDNERWIVLRELGLDEKSLAVKTTQEISENLPDSLSHPYYYGDFIALADAVAVIQDKLKAMVPPWVPCETVMLGVDLSFFSPAVPDLSLRCKYHIKRDEKIIVYHGGMNKFTRPAIRTLCDAVGLVNKEGYPCRLIRTGPNKLNFLDQLPPGAQSMISDLGVISRSELPGLLSLADVFVQPGEIDPFEDLRLPGKVPEFLAMGRPVVMPDVNISYMFKNGEDAVLLRTGSADEIARACIELFNNPDNARKIGEAGRSLAEKYFDVRAQAGRLQKIYLTAAETFNPVIAAKIWQRGDEEVNNFSALLSTKLKLLSGSSPEKYISGVSVLLNEHAKKTDLFQQRVSGLECRLDDLRQTISGLDEYIVFLKGALADREQYIDAIVTSKSWRITRPLRRIMENIRRFYPESKPVLARTHEYFMRKSGKVRRVRPRIAYVINQTDLMTYSYRVKNYADALRSHGYECVIIQHDKLDINYDVDADIIVLNRIIWNENVGELIRKSRESGRTTIFDVDDFVIDPGKVSLLRHFHKSSTIEKENIFSLTRGLEKTMRECDLATVSTFSLKVEIEKRGLPAFVLPNNNGAGQIELAERLCSERNKNPRVNTLRVGYFSGTKTHEEDFEECAEAICRVLQERDDVELVVVGHLDLPPTFRGLEHRIRRFPLLPHMDMLAELSNIDINLAPLEKGNLFTDCKSELKIFEAALLAIPSIASPTSSYASIIENKTTGLLAANTEEWCDALQTLIQDKDLRRRMGEAARNKIAARYAITTTVEEAKAIYNAAYTGALRRLPREHSIKLSDPRRIPVSIVAILYRKSGEVRYFLESLRRQDFPGRYEVLLVDDQTPDDSVDVVRDFQKWAAYAPAGLMEIRIIHNETNVGNCGSRNTAIREARGDVIFVVDADCMFNRSFISSHYTAHMKGDCDVAIGPVNIETRDASPLSILSRHEATPELAEAEAQPQDDVNLDSFVNCITRNFSIARSFLEKDIHGPLFDEAFSYSADPDSGFGWEDVEMGYSIYLSGGRIKYLPDTVSIHVSHASSASETEKPFRSLRNFRRLFEKHPDILTASRQWSVKTFKAIVDWVRTTGTEPAENADYRWLEPRFRRYQQAPIIVDRTRKLRILTHRWHVPHQYELYKTGHLFTLLTGTGTAICDSWEEDKRPIPANAKMLPVERVDPRDFDMAILHFDENALRPDLCNGMVPDDWGQTLQWFLDNVDLPKVAICHGTPQFAGQYHQEYNGSDLGQVLEDERKSIVDLLDDVHVICNSHQAQYEWGFKKSGVIWHGFSPHEFPPGGHERGILVMLEAALLNRPHYNGLLVYESVRRLLGDKCTFEYLRTPEPPKAYALGSRGWSVARYQNYTREVCRYSVYFNPTVRSPMPRARGEAMMAGLVPVSLRNHDVDLFIKNGINGFYADTPEELSEQLVWLSDRPDARINIGRASRATAMDLFNQDRYLSSWSQIMNELTN